MSHSLLLGEEETRRLNYILSLNLVPLQISRVALSRYADSLTVYDQEVLLRIEIDRALELTVHRVILEHVSQVIYRAEVVDTYDLILVRLRLSSAEDHTADTTEAIDTNFDCHNLVLNYKVKPK